MMLAAQVAEFFHMTDNKLLATPVENRKTDSNHMHWKTRETLAMIINSMSNLQANVFHITRDATLLLITVRIRCLQIL
jgi:hypothetical protein